MAEGNVAETSDIAGYGQKLRELVALSSSTAVLQATCVDSTIVPYLENRLNLGHGCYGCRDATDLGANETVLGFPAAMLPAIVKHLEYLAQKAIPASRSKKAWAALQTERPNPSKVE